MSCTRSIMYNAYRDRKTQYPLVSSMSNHRAMRDVPQLVRHCARRLFLARLLDALGARVQWPLALADFAG